MCMHPASPFLRPSWGSVYTVGVLPSPKALLLSLALLTTLTACGTVGETGRRQVTLFSNEYMSQLGAESYAEIVAQHREIKTGRDAEMLRRVGQRIAAASGADFQWEFKLLDAPDVVNAFCLPGGKIAFYTGILKVTQNEDGLAVVMGHEVAHATANHGNERMSTTTALNVLLSGAAAGLSLSKMGESTRELVLQGLGLGAQVGAVLPFSRNHESEADEIGLLYAIRAGYNPEEAPRLWERMAALGSSGPSFMSTHPDPYQRAERLRELIPIMKARVAAEKSAPAR